MKLGTKVPFKKPKMCIPCHGSGWYDNLTADGQQIPCGACDGTGEDQDRDKL